MEKMCNGRHFGRHFGHRFGRPLELSITWLPKTVIHNCSGLVAWPPNPIIRHQKYNPRLNIGVFMRESVQWRPFWVSFWVPFWTLSWIFHHLTPKAFTIALNGLLELQSMWLDTQTCTILDTTNILMDKSVQWRPFCAPFWTPSWISHP